MTAQQPAFLDVSATARWVGREGVEKVITAMADTVQREFIRWPRFTTIPRVASHSPIGVIELMPTSDGEEYGFKYVNGHPYNPSSGFQTVTAFGVLADVVNGYPTFVAEMTLLTAVRTAAVSSMVARALARPESRVMALIGAGSQSEFQALGMRGVVGVDTLRVFDVDPAAVEKLRRNLEPLGFDIYAATSAADACQGADIITTCIADKANNHVLSVDDIAPGQHLNAIGGDCPGKTELDPRILTQGRVFVEYPPQTRVEGEIQQMPEDFPVTEIWRVLAGKEPGRETAEEVTIFDSVGFAIADFAALRHVRDATAGSDLLTTIELIADPDDPKDLFSLTRLPVALP